MKRESIPVGHVVCLALLFLSISSSAASASAPRLRCFQQPCPFALTGDGFDLRFGGNKIKCQAVRGAGRFSTHTTGALSLSFRGCREQVSVFGFSCGSATDPSPALMATNLATHILEEAGTRKIQALGLRTSFVCGGLGHFLIEGFIYIHIGDGQCGVNARSHRMLGELIAHGRYGSEAFSDVFVNGSEWGDFEFRSPWNFRFRTDSAFLC